jgi:signal transduction histidine kinase
VTGVQVKREFGPTLELALRLHPGTRQVTFIAGTSPFNRFWTERARAELREYEGRVKLTYLTDLPIESIREEVSRLPEHSLILYLHLFRDGAERTFGPNEALSLIAERANAPIYVFFDQYVGLGCVGGSVYSVEAHGAKAGETALRVLRGERPESIPVVDGGTSVKLFDARQLRRWGVAESALPPGAVVRFREVSFWVHYRWHVATAAAVIATQAVLIFAMIAQLRRRRVAEAARGRAEADAQQRRAELAHLSRVASLGELTAALAHELSQPLTAILGNAGAGQRFLASPTVDVSEVRDTLADITSDTQRARDIIARLRGMLKRGGPAESAPVNMNDVIRTVERLVRGERLRHEVTVELDLAPDLAPTTGDTIQLQQVVMNLMLNAFAAMDQPGRVKRRLLVRTRAAADGAHVEAEFQDSGAGIAAEVIDRLFEPFVTTKPDGLGMGLSICRTILDNHRGKLRAANNPAGGAIFTLTLPAGGTSRRRSVATGTVALSRTKVQ